MPVMAMLRLGWFRALLAGMLTTAIVVTGGMWLLRQQVLDGETRTLAALARSMALGGDRTAGVASTLLRVTQDELARGLVQPEGVGTDELMRQRVRATPGFRSMSLFDDQGRRIASSRDDELPPPEQVVERDFFRAARRAGQSTLFLSEPFAARGGGPSVLSLSTGWYDAHGHFRGVLALLAEPPFLERDFERIANGDVSLSVYRDDGTPLYPAAGDPAQPLVLPAGLVRRLARTPDELDVAEEVSFGERRLLVTAAPLQEVKLVQVVWRDLDEVLSGWTELLGLVGLVVAAMLSVTLVLAVRVARQRWRGEELERRLARSRKLEALGNLAGGVAHDFNNVLAAVVGFAEVARDGVAEGGREARLLERILQAGERGRQQVERILAFSRGQPRRSEVFVLQTVVAEVLDHLAASSRSGVMIGRDLQAPEAAVKGDPTSTYEAVMNLCTNALLAMPEGGQLDVSLTLRDEPQARQLYDRTLAPGRYLHLTVRDTGVGMAPEVLARLFEPFFSTRSGHGGSGIGLAVVHSVVLDLRGGVDVRSQPGEGTTFTLLLPVVDEAVPVAEAPSATRLPAGQGESVLVVDDEAALVEVAEEMLVHLGYEPLGTTSAVAALEALRRDPGRYDLLLTDEVMPGLSGVALARAAREIRPDLPVVIASGFGGDQFEARALEAGVSVVLTKPIQRADLARALRRALQPALHP